MNPPELIKELAESVSLAVATHQSRDFPWHLETALGLIQEDKKKEAYDDELKHSFEIKGSNEFEKHAAKKEIQRWLDQIGIHPPNEEQWLLEWADLKEYDFDQEALSDRRPKSCFQDQEDHSLEV